CRSTRRFADADPNGPPPRARVSPKWGELRFATGFPGLKVLKRLRTAILNVRLYRRPVVPPEPNGFPPAPLRPRGPKPPPPRGPPRPPGPPNPPPPSPPFVSRPKPKVLLRRRFSVVLLGPVQKLDGTSPKLVGVAEKNLRALQLSCSFALVSQGRSLKIESKLLS